MKISNDLAEFVGIVLGDGYIHKNENTIIISGSLDDFYYFKFHVAHLIERIFDTKPCIYFQKERGACYICIRSKDSMKTILNIGLRRGKKDYKIPKSLYKPSLYPHILRGLFDTDGCLKFSKQTKGINYYPRIQIAMKPSDITNFISIMLDDLKFNYSEWTSDNSRGFGHNGKLEYFYVSGRENLEKWMKNIGSSNPVQISKYMIWKENGFCKPSNFSVRLKLLNTSASMILEHSLVV